jgi:integrase
VFSAPFEAPKPPRPPKRTSLLARHDERMRAWAAQVDEMRARARETPMPVDYAQRLLERTFQEAGVKRPHGFGFHTLRRKLARDLKGEGIAVTMAIGGWKESDTLVERYYQVTPEDQAQALARRPRPPLGTRAAETEGAAS